jgi:peptidoglycan/LPS O-acetylase OafA/YrhL
MVFWGHADLVDGSGTSSVAMFLFFALSGFLITALLVAEHARTGTVSLRRFFARRALRLVPALAAFLACWLTVDVVLGAHRWMTTVPDFHGPGGAEPFPVALEGVGAALGYVTNWVTVYHLTSGYVPLGHLWSLAVEEQFYLFWAPALVALLAVARRRDVRRWSVLLGASALGIASTAWAATLATGPGPRIRIYMGTDTRAGAFLLGGAVAILSGSATGKAAFAALRGRRTPVVMAVVAAVALAWTSWQMQFPVTPDAYVADWVVDTVAAPLLVLGLVTWPSPRGPHALTGRVVTYLGRRSYALYLWHYVWLTWLRGAGAVGVVEALVASVCCAEISWHLVEARALAYKKRFAARAVPSDSGSPSDPASDSADRDLRCGVAAR